MLSISAQPYTKEIAISILAAAAISILAAAAIVILGRFAHKHYRKKYPKKTKSRKLKLKGDAKSTRATTSTKGNRAQNEEVHLSRSKLIKISLASTIAALATPFIGFSAASYLGGDSAYHYVLLTLIILITINLSILTPVAYVLHHNPSSILRWALTHLALLSIVCLLLIIIGVADELFLQDRTLYREARYLSQP